jgi:hypothetical protein
LGANHHVCICETLRFIYDEVESLEDGERKQRMTELLIDALIMAKKIADRLGYYYKTYGDSTGTMGKELPLIADASATRKRRKARQL